MDQGVRGREESERSRRHTECVSRRQGEAGSLRVETGGRYAEWGRVRGGWKAGGCRETRTKGSPVPGPRSPSAHSARTVLPLAKSRLLYRSRSDPPNWLLMTP